MLAPTSQYYQWHVPSTTDCTACQTGSDLALLSLLVEMPVSHIINAPPPPSFVLFLVLWTSLDPIKWRTMLLAALVYMYYRGGGGV